MSIDQPYALRFTRHAAHDLDELFRYISYELDAEKAAKELMREVETSISNLREFPYSAPQSRNDLLARKGYRTLTVRKKYLVVYRVYADKRMVIVHRIFYGQRDYTKLV